MDAVDFLHQDLKWAHELLEMVMQDVTEEQLTWLPPRIANPLGATYAHAVCTEDSVVQQMLRGQPALFSSEWQGKTGISAPQQRAEFDWARQLEVDLPKAREYAGAVYASTESYVGGLSDGDLDREIDLTDWGFGVRTVAWVLAALVIAHLNNMAGEVSCLKGLQGARGYPF